MSQPNKKQKQALEDVLELLQTEFNLPKDIFKKPNVRPDSNRDPGEDDVIDDPEPEPSQCLDVNNSPDGTNRACQNISIDVIGGAPKPYCSGNRCRECVIDRHCFEGFVCIDFSCELPADDIPIPTIGCLDPLALNFNDGTYSGEYTCPDSETTCQAWLDESLSINDYRGDWINEDCCCYNVDGINVDIVPGDVNDDGVSNVQDIVAMVNYVLGDGVIPNPFDIYIPPSSPEEGGQVTWYLGELRQIADILQEYFDVNIDVNPQLSNNLQIVLSNLNLQINDIQQTITDYESYFSDIITTINNYFPEEDFSQLDYSFYNTIIGGYLSELVTANETITNLQSQLDTANSTISDLEMDLILANQVNESNLETISELTNQASELQAQVEGLQTQVDELQVQVSDLQNALDVANQANANNQITISELTNQVLDLQDLNQENVTDYTLLTTYLGLSYTLTDDDIQAGYNLDDGSVTCSSYLDPVVGDNTTRCLPSNATDGLGAITTPTIYIEAGRFTGFAVPSIEGDLNLGEIMNASFFADVDLTIPCTWCDATQLGTDSNIGPGTNSGFIGSGFSSSWIEFGLSDTGWFGDELLGNGYYYYIFTPEVNPNSPEGCCTAGYFKVTIPN